MTDGGFFAWKRQEIDIHRGPTASYASIKKPLKAPKGMHWTRVLAQHDDDTGTNEWKLEPDDTDNDDTQEPTDSLLLVQQHSIQSTDTFVGICLKYKITPKDLRRANGGFSGTNLGLAPNPLVIPHGKQKHGVVETTNSSTNKEPTRPQKVRQLKNACSTHSRGSSSLSEKEATCYLELNDWNLEQALQNARQDGF
jgi:hypothetical protein